MVVRDRAILGQCFWCVLLGRMKWQVVGNSLWPESMTELTFRDAVQRQRCMSRRGDVPIECRASKQEAQDRLIK